MKITLISGSHRSYSQSSRVAAFLADEIQKAGHTADVVDLAKTPLPLWDEGVWAGTGHAAEAWAPIKPRLKVADAVIIIAPEWNGTAPAALKNFFHFVSSEEFAHKPGLLVSVTSGGTNGAYPIAELRMTSSKNNKLVYVPDHLIVRNVGQILSDNPEDEGGDAYMRERAIYSLELLYAYAEALKPIRESALWHSDKFRYGM